jgi:predicted nucleotidyltransferase
MQTLSKQAVINTLIEKHHQLQALHASRLGVFGSVVRDEARQDSDIDLLWNLKRDTRPLITLLIWQNCLKMPYGALNL